MTGAARATLLAILALCTAESSSAQGRSPATPADSIRILTRVVAAEQRFVADWRSKWLVSMRMPWTGEHATPHRYAMIDETARPLVISYEHCRREGPFQGSIRPVATIMTTASSARSHCPSWSLYVGHLDPDMSVVLDSGLAPQHRAVAARMRDSLITLIDSAASALPGDGFVSGQRVRFLVDQGYTDPIYYDRAIAAARECHADKWWCAALAGYALQSRGSLASADSAFLVAISLTPARFDALGST